MKYLVHLSDADRKYLVLLAPNEHDVSQAAIDFVFNVIGTINIEDLVARDIVPSGQVEDLKALQQLIFDTNNQEVMIKNEVSFSANGKELDPDSLFIKVFLPAELDGAKYSRCDLVVSTLGPPVHSNASIENLSRMFFIHEIAVGQPLDVTQDYPQLTDILNWAEHENLIEIDVTKATYKLTFSGKQLHDSYIAEAQALIKKYDIYSDVDVDSTGTARFDTGLGKDLRVPIFEIDGVDPFLARFLLGLNDGEWDSLSNWYEVIQNEKWYGNIFAPIEQAPAVAKVGRAQLLGIIEQAKAILRTDAQLQ